LADAILTPTLEPSLLSSQIQQRPGHPHVPQPKPIIHTAETTNLAKKLCLEEIVCASIDA